MLKFALGGWKLLKTGHINGFECPICSHWDEFLSYEKRKPKCYRCNNSYTENRIKKNQRKKKIAICKKCESEVPITENSFSFPGYKCYECNNYVAIKYRNYIIQPKTVFKLVWNKNVNKRRKIINKNLFLIKVKTDKDKIILDLMQSMVNSESNHTYFFHHYTRGKNDKAILLINKEKYLGYFIWNVSKINNEKYAVARQIFLLPEERKKGIGPIFTKFWVKNYADKINKRFGAENPSEKRRRTLHKLGYIKKIKDEYKASKCFPVQTG